MLNHGKRFKVRIFYPTGNQCSPGRETGRFAVVDALGSPTKMADEIAIRQMKKGGR